LPSREIYIPHSSDKTAEPLGFLLASRTFTFHIVQIKPPTTSIIILPVFSAKPKHYLKVKNMIFAVNLR